ncbi:MAG: hypothetical protein OEL79_02130 [Chromatiales bacterium]|nr:hypothetical protein [Chromatiales bacterium]
MNKTEVQKIRIDIVSNDQSALSMLFDQDGRISRQGSGTLPADEFSVVSENDGSIFTALIESLDDNVFEHSGVYDHPNKAGEPITYSVVFLGNEPEVSVFEFRLGTETKDVGDLMPYFDQFISKAVEGTNQWYAAEKVHASQAAQED